MRAPLDEDAGEREPGIEHEATTVQGPGQVQAPPRFRAPRPIRVEGGTTFPIGTPAPAPQRHDEERDHQPAPTGDQPVAEGVPALERPLPLLLEPIGREPGGREDGVVEILTALQPAEQWGQRLRRIASRELGDRRGRERIRRVGARLRAPERAVELGQRGNAPPDDCQIELETAEPLPLARGPGRVAFVEPERHAHRHRLVEREVRQLVAERPGEIALIGAEQDGPGPGHGHRRAPCRRADPG